MATKELSQIAAPLNHARARHCRQPQQSMTQALSILESVFGFPSFLGKQGEIIEHVANGGDALVLMPTGGGKSLCFQIPALMREGCGIVASPQIALMINQLAALREAGVRAACPSATLATEEATKVEREL